MEAFGRQLVLLHILPIPIASIEWTVIYEEVFREPREWCAAKSRSCRRLHARKFRENRLEIAAAESKERTEVRSSQKDPGEPRGEIKP